MEEKTFIYKSNQMFSFLTSCMLDINYLKKLYDILDKVTLESAEFEILKLKKPPDKTDDEFDKLKEYARSLYKVSIQIFGSKGEYIFSESLTVFDETQLPDHIDKIIFDNSLKYNFYLKQEPSNKIKIEFDFRKPRVFDFVKSPSEATPNHSSIYVIGSNETWVSGAYNKVMESLKERSNKRDWLHKNNIYDLFIWFLIVPMSFWIIYRIDRIFFLRSGEVSTVFIVVIYLYFFIFTLNFFRMIFNYARWVFPKIELITSLKKGAIKHRLFLGTILLGIFTALLYDLIKLILMKTK